MEKEINIWYDKEGDFLEVMFEKKEGYFKETDNDSVMEKVDRDGHIIGFSILKVNDKKNKMPIRAHLRSVVI